MSPRYKAAFACYALSMLLLMWFGVQYFFASELRPYHAAALGQSLAEMPTNFQITFITLYRSIGAGMLSSAVAFAFLLIVPFRGGELWSRWALTVSGLTFGGLATYLTLAFKAATGIDAPWPAAIGGMVLIVVGHALATGKAKV